MGGLPDPDWYVEHVLMDAIPGWSRPLRNSPTREWRASWQGRATDADPVLAAAAQQGFVLGPGQLADLGVGRSTTRTQVHRGSWSSPMAGVVAPLDVDDGASPFVVERRRHALVTAASALRNPALVACGRSAAVLRGLPTLRVPDRAEMTSQTTRGLGSRAVTHRYRAGLDLASVGTWFGSA